jgi:hypothetical protein
MAKKIRQKILGEKLIADHHHNFPSLKRVFHQFVFSF